MPVISAFQRLRQEDQEFEIIRSQPASLGYLKLCLKQKEGRDVCLAHSYIPSCLLSHEEGRTVW